MNTGKWLIAWALGLAATLAVMLAVGLVAIYVFKSPYTPFAFTGAAAIWAAWDSSRIGLQRYRSQMANEQFMVLFLCFAFFIPCFPWYVAVRQGIRWGLVPLKTEATQKVFD